MAHLLEHMLFKGTEATPDPKQEFTRRGMRWNAPPPTPHQLLRQFNATSRQDWMLGWFADTMSNIRITPELLDGERPVVKNEMHSSENRPQRILYQQLMGVAYEFHPYGRTVIGNESDLAGVQPTQLQGFYQRYYRPDNASLVVTGSFDEQQLLSDLDKAFAKVARHRPRSSSPTRSTKHNKRARRKLRRSGGIPLMYVGYQMMPAQHVRRGDVAWR